jgi:PhnB protein
MKTMFPSEKHKRIINAHLKNGEVEISATDWMASPEFNPIQGNMSAIFVTGKNHDEMKIVFDKLAEGADKIRFQELHDMPFGVYGQFYDKYRIQWIFVVEKK